MKQILTVLLILVFSVGQLFAKEVKTETAQKAAVNFYTQISGIHLNTKAGLSEINLTYTGTLALDTVFYAFSVKNNNGFVLISADDAVKPILAYSMKGSFSGTDLPPATSYLINEYSEQINLAKRNGTKASEATSSDWAKLLSNNIHKTTETPPEPLLLTNWNQGYPYNEFCPEDPAGPAGHALVGCVAISIAQVMKYYNFPAQGSGTSNYYASGYGNQSANYGNTHYEFYNMPNTGTESNASLAEFLYHCGVASEMNYGPNASGAWVSKACQSMESHFNYSSDWEYNSRNSYSDNQWKNLIKNEIDNLRPTIYVGYTNSSGHAWNCDGYQNDYFHMNWGWGGSYNGYYNIDQLTPGSSDFYAGHKLAFNLYPSGNYPDYCSSMTQISGTEGTFNDGSGPEKYQNNVDCFWEIVPDCGQNIYLEFDQFNVHSGDTLYVYAGLSTSDELLAKLSDTLEIPELLFAANGGMLLNFVTNSDTTSSGWTVSYSVDYCFGKRNLTDEFGSLGDGSGDCNYKDASLCKWLIDPDGADSISFDFSYFDLFDDIDNVKIYEGDMDNLVAKFNYSNQPYPVTVKSGSALVYFFTNGSNNGGGWNLNYEAHFNPFSIENEGNTNFQVYPNPVNDILHISFDSFVSEDVWIGLVNTLGQIVVQSNEDLTGLSESALDLSGIKPGVYFVHLRTNSHNTIHKIIKR